MKRRARSSPNPTPRRPQLPAKLSKTEQDLLWHMSHGYQLETSSLGNSPILRRLKDNTEVRAIANRSTIEALEKGGLITMTKSGGAVNPTVWRLTQKGNALKLTEPHH